MLPEPSTPCWSEADRLVFEHLVPENHYLRLANALIDFASIAQSVTCYYSPDQGRPAIVPVRMIKFEFLQYHDNLSDRQVIDRAGTDVAYRQFLELPMTEKLPDSSSLCYFRTRLGAAGHRTVFDAIVAQARQHGLVKDRLRIKDATHVIADVAIPTTLALVARTRDKLLQVAAVFDRQRVTGEELRAEAIRRSTDSLTPDARLVARVTHLREVLAWVDDLLPPDDAEQHPAWQALQKTKRLAHKILADQDDPQAGDRTRSDVDPDARRGKHGPWYDGYLLDVMIDADSELITAVDVLPANGAEAANAAELVCQEQTAHGNKIESLSIDGVAFQGPVLRQLESPQGLGLDLYVPPAPEAPSTLFAPCDFTEDPQAGTLTCPAGRTTRQRERNPHNTGWKYRFVRHVCCACPLLNRCMETAPQSKHGRTVIKNEYEVEYARMRAKAHTPQYAAIRREHPKIERKLADLVRRHGMRRTRYRGRAKVQCGALLAALAANVKRIVRLLTSSTVLSTT